MLRSDLRTCSVSAFFAVLLLSIFPTASGQEPSRELARLISTSADATVARPRVVDRPANISRSPSIDDATSIERRAFDLTNEVRQRNSLSPLQWDPELCRMARVHSEKMARGGFFAHETPEGHRLRDRARSSGIGRFKVLAENIAYNQGFEDPGAFAVERWLFSSKHRANILHNEFQAAAVGVFVADNGAVYLTQAFIAR